MRASIFLPLIWKDWGGVFSLYYILGKPATNSSFSRNIRFSFRTLLFLLFNLYSALTCCNGRGWCSVLYLSGKKPPSQFFVTTHWVVCIIRAEIKRSLSLILPYLLSPRETKNLCKQHWTLPIMLIHVLKRNNFTHKLSFFVLPYFSALYIKSVIWKVQFKIQ